MREEERIMQVRDKEGKKKGGSREERGRQAKKVTSGMEERERELGLKRKGTAMPDRK